MNKLKTLLCLLAFFPLLVYAADEQNFSVKSIRPGLLSNANAVVRAYNIEMDIVSLQKVNIKEHYVVTVLNDKGDKYANRVESYSNLRKIEKIYGYIYDADGETVTKIKQSDFKDVPMFRGYTEYSDNKLKIYNVSYRKYPYTVEYVIETSQNHTFYLPVWSPIASGYCSIEAASLTVTIHGSTNLRYKQFLVGPPPAITNGDEKQYKWSVTDFTARNPEPMSKPEYTTPTILLATDNFMLDDYTGNMSTWQGYGQFIYDINKGRDILPDDVKKKITQMTAGINDERQKINILYVYLQSSMRYVAVEYGVGGWQTLDAAFLSKNQYGDCKALSNYMMAMLAAVGISAYPVNIFAGDEHYHELVKDFVCNQFNHIILCVPFAKDTVWLECTSNEFPAGYLSDFTQNRDALMITPQGGVLVHTPVYDTTVNKEIRHAEITITEDGLKISMYNLYSGEAATYLHHVLKYDNDHEREEYLQSKFHLSSYTIDDYKFQKIDNAPVTSVSENVKITAKGLNTQTGSRIFVLLDVYPINISEPYESGERKASFYIPESKAYCDTFEMQIPEKYDVEFIPPAVSLQYPFGSYYCSVVKKESKLVMTRKFTLNCQTYEAALFDSYLKLISTANNESHKKVVLKNKQ